MRSFVASPVFSLSGFGELTNRRSVYAAPENGLIIVSAPMPPPDALRQQSGVPLTGYTTGPLSIEYVCAGMVQEVEIDNGDWLFSKIQPLGLNQWLLVRGRADSGEANAVVYDTAGNLLRTFPVGDGVKDVQTTADGKEIWVSYFDEGVFTDQPLSPSHEGVVCFGTEGQIQFRFNAQIVSPGFAPFIGDCYAMNVHDDGNTYLCYYGDFPLLQIRDRRLTCSWQAMATEAIAVTDQYALLAPAYVLNPFHLMYLDNSCPPEEVLLVTETGKILETGRYYTPPHRGVFARGSRMYVRDADTLYCVDLAFVPELA